MLTFPEHGSLILRLSAHIPEHGSLILRLSAHIPEQGSLGMRQVSVCSCTLFSTCIPEYWEEVT